MALVHHPLAPDLAVAPQIDEADIAEAARLGYRTIINNRPDGEEPGQLPAARAEAVAKALGIDYRHIPVNAQTMGPAVWRAFSQALREAPHPVLAHCRSGTRCTHLWAYQAAEDEALSLDEIIEHGARAGYDLAPLRPMLERIRRHEV
jgi:uncharacterized protein (TIGR01244 family)